MKLRFLALLAAASVTAAALTGCAAPAVPANADAQSAEQSATAAGDVTLRFSWWGGDERNAATLDVIEQFEAAHPGVTIEAEYGGNEGYHDKLATQLASGTAPDIVQVDPEIFPSYIANGDYFIDYADYGVNTANFEEAYISLPINGRYDGKQLGLPTGISGAGIIVNKKLAEEIGLDFTQPLTWDSLIEMGKMVRAYDDSMYLLCANKEYVANLVVFNYIKQLIGSTMINADVKTLNFDEAQLTQTFEYVKKLFDEGVVAPASYQASYSGDNLQSDGNWIAGKYVAALSYVSTIDVMVAANPEAEYYMSQLPRMDGCTETGWASNTPQVLAITKTSANAEIAAQFIDYFFNDDTALATLGCTRSVPPTEKARQICVDKGVLSACTMQGADIAAAMGGTPNDKISSTPESKAILFDSVEAIGFGASEPAKAAADAMSLYFGLIK